MTSQTPPRGAPSTTGRRLLLLGPALAVIGVFFVGGVSQAVAQSLGYQPLLGTTRWSLDAYRAAATDPAVQSSVVLTLRIGLLATGIFTVLGVLAALTVRRLGRGRRWMQQLFQSALAVPHLVGALCIGLLLAPTGFLSRLLHAGGVVDSPSDLPALIQDRFGWGIIAEYVWKETPFMAVIALTAMSTGLTRLEDASRTLGAGRLQRLRHVTLPILAPRVASASVLVLAFTMGSYEVPYLLGRPFPAPLSVVAYQSFRDTDLTTRPQAMAVAVIITALTLVIATAYLSLVRRLVGRSL